MANVQGNMPQSGIEIYTARGNIIQLQRYSDNRLIDDLHFSYQQNGNQLLSIRDDGEDTDLYSTIEYHSAMQQADTTMFYDTNGNLITNADRGISVIKYNILNLPDTIQFCNGNQIVNLYDAAGCKYKSLIYTATPTTECVVTEYSGNTELCYTQTDTISYRIFNNIGYYADSAYFYYVKDHLGNVCAVVNANADSVIQRTMYYTSGVPMATSSGRDQQPYLYNGKEYITAHGLNEYNSQARMYYATIMRTTTMDPHAEKYYHISPYAWCGNNPILNVDINGQYYYDWNDGAYHSSYGTNAVVEWSEIVDNNYIEPVPLEETTPLLLLLDFIFGNGQGGFNFTNNDRFTQIFLKDNDKVNNMYANVKDAIFNDEKNEGDYNFSIRNSNDITSILLQDIKSVFSLGLQGNMAATLIGSFSAKWQVIGYDKNGDAVVKFTIFNAMTAHSALRPPFRIGYSSFYTQKIAPIIDGIFSGGFLGSGIMAPINITITWTVTLKDE